MVGFLSSKKPELGLFDPARLFSKLIQDDPTRSSRLFFIVSGELTLQKGHSLVAAAYPMVSQTCLRQKGDIAMLHSLVCHIGGFFFDSFCSSSLCPIAHGERFRSTKLAELGTGHASGLKNPVAVLELSKLS